jgi:hypothetical protein
VLFLAVVVSAPAVILDHTGARAAERAGQRAWARRAHIAALVALVPLICTLMLFVVLVAEAVLLAGSGIGHQLNPFADFSAL